MSAPDLRRLLDLVAEEQAPYIDELKRLDREADARAHRRYVALASLALEEAANRAYQAAVVEALALAGRYAPGSVS